MSQRESIGCWHSIPLFAHHSRWAILWGYYDATYRTKPMLFPPEHLRSIGINIRHWSIDQAGKNHGHENVWLRLMD